MNTNPISSNSVAACHNLSRRSLQLSRSKLEQTSRTSALLAGFAMVAIVELDVYNNGNARPPEGLLIAFTTLACLLVVVHILALMISICILPHIECYADTRDDLLSLEAPHYSLRIFIEVAWIFSTVIGILLFLSVVILACWIKFWSYNISAAIAGTLIIIPSTVVFLLCAALFYRTLVMHKVERATEMMQNLDVYLSMLEKGNHVVSVKP